MTLRTYAYAAVLAAGALTGPLFAGQDIEPGIGIDQIGQTRVMSTRWLDRSPGDFGAAKLIADPAGVPASRHVETATVHFAWPIAEAPTPTLGLPRVDSRQYWVDAVGSDLAKGLQLPLTAPGAVIRVSPLDANAKLRIDPARISLSLGGRALSADAIERLAHGPSLKAAGMDVPEASLAFQLSDTAPAGLMKMEVGGLPADERMVVHVFEPRSPWSGQLTLPARDFFVGDTVTMGFGIGDGKSQLSVASVQAVITDPTAEQQFEVRLDPTTGALIGELPEALATSGLDGLFEAHAYLETSTPDGLIVRRDLKIPFSVAPPLARLDGEARALLGEGLVVEVGIEAAVAGRYQLNGQIFGSAPDGSMEPMALAQVAGTLTAGKSAFQLKVDRATVENSGLGAPFEVRGLELLDQGRMFRLQRQQRALLIAR